ncbi:MAG: 2-succinyl-5-enolpyruvyl-6-hydroxy-3-cyclohexene-1-carboxylic-acid synthase [Chitinophagales bacterium]|nr:2-succinyl-5-enolpyruvyl-6-hydroxy-3-cyclohexene-1-carboxylic-acid synthase [Chitinophagales bacterium]
MGLDTDKHWIRDLAAICAAKGLTKIVLSPGSRCAPLVIAFNRHPQIDCYSIVDERCAAFFALGMAQQLQQPVGLVCTSGSAVLNFAPAIAEAYYQKVPLVVFTADRPNELIDQQDGQTLRQYEIYRNYIKKSFELPSEVQDNDTLWYSNRMVSEAINIASYPDMGPVHVNVPLKEPLYGLMDYDGPAAPKIIKASPVQPQLTDEAFAEVFEQWNGFASKMIVAGGTMPNERLTKAIRTLSDRADTIIMAEITANLHGEHFINCLDPALEAISKDDKPNFRPELLITFGGALVSKKLKTYLRTYPPKAHWHVDPGGAAVDTFKQLTRLIAMQPVHFFEALAARLPLNNEGQYQHDWLKIRASSYDKHNQQLAVAPHSDLKVFEVLMKHLPANSNLQLGNSTPVRYASLFPPDPSKHITVNCNRGTSGIDGTVSTAAGAAFATAILTTLITGDVAFFYDSNALWNKQLPPHLKIIVVNNGGGNIFRIIQGPSQLEELEQFFETGQGLTAKGIAQTYGLPYYHCSNYKELDNILPDFFAPKPKAAILEINTPNTLSANMMRKYLNI